MAKAKSKSEAKRLATLAKEPEKTEKIISKFSLKTISWKFNEVVWNVQMTIYAELSKAFIHYSVKIEFDESPFLERIRQCENDMINLETDNGMFDEYKEKDIDQLQAQAEEIKAQMEKRREECQTIEFDATLIKADWSGTNASVVFAVNDEMIEQLNKHKAAMSDYRIVMEPIIN